VSINCVDRSERANLCTKPLGLLYGLAYVCCHLAYSFDYASCTYSCDYDEDHVSGASREGQEQNVRAQEDEEEVYR